MDSLDGKVLVLKRIHVTYAGFEFTETERETLRRAVATHAHGCPVARSLEGAIEITTAVQECLRTEGT